MVHHCPVPEIPTVMVGPAARGGDIEQGDLFGAPPPLALCIWTVTCLNRNVNVSQQINIAQSREREMVYGKLCCLAKRGFGEVCAQLSQQLLPFQHGSLHQGCPPAAACCQQCSSFPSPTHSSELKKKKENNEKNPASRSILFHSFKMGCLFVLGASPVLVFFFFLSLFPPEMRFLLLSLCFPCPIPLGAGWWGLLT